MNARHAALPLLVVCALLAALATFGGATASPRPKRRPLLVRDALGHDVGLYEWRQSDGVTRQAGSFVAWFDLAQIRSDTGVLFFDGADCTGQPYVAQDPNSIMPLGMSFGSSLYYPVEGPANATIVSASSAASGFECAPVPDANRNIWASKANDLETAHFTVPFALEP
jgi:hypothetical protein